MKVFALVILCAATVFGQNPYEYVDDALLQKVGKIIFDYDQRIAASRSTGGSSSSSNGYQQNAVDISARSGGYQYQQPQRSVSNYDYNSNYRSQQNYNTYQPQQSHQVNRVQRQYNYNPVQVSQQPQPVAYQSYQNQRQYSYNPVQVSQQPQVMAYQSSRNQRQLASPYSYQAPQQQRTYQEPQVQQKSSGLSGYILSEPIPIARVAEFHFTDSQGQQGSGDAAGASPVKNNNKFNENSNSHHNNGFRLA